MANSISVWYSVILQWAQVSTESVRINYPDPKKLRSDRTGIKVPVLSPEDEIISQMSKEYPSLFMT